MTSTEFSRWWADATARWPSLAAWLARALPDEHRQREMLRSWLGVLGDVASDNAMEVNRLMQSGELPFVGSENKNGEVFDSDRERLPQHVRRLAKRIAWERSGRFEQREAVRFDGSISNSPRLKQILGRWQELQGEGHSRDDSREMALAEFPIGQSPYREPRYNCPLCLDSGRVIVASNAAIQAVLRGTFDACHHRESVMRCKCELGRGLVRKSQGRELPWAAYDAGICFKVQDSLVHNDAEVGRFREWVDDQQEQRATAMAQANPNYERLFDQFGQTQTAEF